MALAAGAVCSAQTVRVEYWAANAQSPSFSADFFSGVPISNLPLIGASVARVNIYSVGGSGGGLANVGQITLSGQVITGLTNSGGPRVDLILGQGPTPAPGSPLAPMFNNFGGIKTNTALQSRLHFTGSIRNNATGPLQVATVNRLHVGGTLAQSIDAIGGGAGVYAIGLITAGRIIPLNGSNPSIVARTGAIGSILADQEIVIPAAGSISAKSGIGAITATSINAQIFADAFGGDGDMNFIFCSGGDFRGRLQCNNLRSPEGDMASTVLYTSGAIIAPIIIHNDLFGGVGADASEPGTNNSITSFKIGRDMRGVISCEGNINSITIGGSILLDTNSFVAPNIHSRTGTINILSVDGDIDGDAANTVAIQAKDFGFFHVAGDCRANISHYATFGPVNIKSFDVGGTFLGSLYADRFDNTIKVGGDIANASLIRLAGPLPANRAISVGRSLHGTIRIGGALALNGQVILNANNDPFGEWAPDGEIHIGTGPNSSPLFYTRGTFPFDSTLYGTGSVGIVRFNIRPNDCLPRPNSTLPHVALRTWPADRSMREVVAIAFDGPVFAKEPSPLIIRAGAAMRLCLSDECSTDTSDVSDRFDVLVAPPGFPRQVLIAPKTNPDGSAGSFANLHNYDILPRIIDGESILRCDNTNVATGVNIAPFVYRLSIGGFDLDGDGKVSPTDIDRWFDAPEDFNADALADDDDFGLVVEGVLGRR